MGRGLLKNGKEAIYECFHTLRAPKILVLEATGCYIVLDLLQLCGNTSNFGLCVVLLLAEAVDVALVLLYLRLCLTQKLIRFL